MTTDFTRRTSVILLLFWPLRLQSQVTSRTSLIEIVWWVVPQLCLTTWLLAADEPWFLIVLKIRFSGLMCWSNASRAYNTNCVLAHRFFDYGKKRLKVDLLLNLTWRELFALWNCVRISRQCRETEARAFLAGFLGGLVACLHLSLGPETTFWGCLGGNTHNQGFCVKIEEKKSSLCNGSVWFFFN